MDTAKIDKIITTGLAGGFTFAGIALLSKRMSQDTPYAYSYRVHSVFT